MNNSTEKHGYKGECLCGSIKYEVDEIESQMGHCHCSMCRKFHGAAFATFGEAKAKDFHWVKGKECLKTYTAPNGTRRQFCEHCGSSLIFIPSNDDGELVEFTLGTLDSPIILKPDAHIFIGNKACWYEVMDKLPQYTKNRSS
ncbi:MAG: GFA family protein [Kangiellaceae bacterium]|nr:GFA family protein [Kangiellaceae bacterium]